MIPYGRQSISEADIAAVVDTLRSDFLTQGPAVPLFEGRVANHCGARRAVAFSNATAALHVACLALGIGPGDLVWTSPITFVASANCALYCGADVDFVDIDPATYNLCPARLEQKLLQAEAAGRLPKLVIPVHLAGQSCDMAAIHALSRRFGFRIVEDASHAIGAEYRGEPVGSGRYSDITIFSFHPVKIVTTGEGGMALTNDDALAESLALLRSHGITRDREKLRNPDHGPWYYEQVQLGFNYRLTDIQAALGASQMTRLRAFVDRRLAIAARYDEAFGGNDKLVIPCQRPDTRSSYHLYILRLADAERHREIFCALRERGIGVNLHYIPVYLQPFYADLGFRPGHCPEAEAYYGSAISIPMFPDLTDEDQMRVIEAVNAVLAA